MSQVDDILKRKVTVIIWFIVMAQSIDCRFLCMGVLDRQTPHFLLWTKKKLASMNRMKNWMLPKICNERKKL
jgi:hypothetical protein